MTSVDLSLPGSGLQADSSADDSRVPVMLWTLVAAGGAGGLGLIFMVLRMAMGWVKPPPAPDESH